MSSKIKISIFIIIICSLSLTACNKDFLNRQPQDVLSSDNPLATTNEMRLFLNQFYETSFPSHHSYCGRGWYCI